MEFIDEELEAILDDPPLPSEYLSKRVNTVLKTVNLAEDQSLKQSVMALEMDSEFLNKHFV